MAVRRHNKRKYRRRGRFGFLYKLLSFVAILVAILAGCVVFFRVNQVEVVGNNRYTADQIIAIAGVEVGDNLLLLSNHSIVSHLRTELPYIKEVSLRRSLPDTLVITIAECAPVAVVQGDGAWWVMDERCKILEGVQSSAVTGAALVTGITATLPSEGTFLAVADTERAKLDCLTELMGILASREMLGKISSIDLTEVSRVSLLYDGRITAVLPIVDTQLDTKIRALQMAVDTYLQVNDTGTLDLTQEMGGQWFFHPG